MRAVGEGRLLRQRSPIDDMRLPLDDMPATSARVRALVAGHIAQASDAEDVAQDVIERVMRHRAQLRDPERAEAWLARIVRNAVVDHYRRRRLPDATDPALLDAVAAAAEAGPAISSRLAPCVHPFVDALPHTYAEALRLTDLGPHTQEGAAAHLGLSVSGMKSRVQRGRRLLEAALRGCCDVELDARGGVTDVVAQPSSRCSASAPCLADPAA